MFEFNEKTLYNIIVGVYIIIGLLFVYFDKIVPDQYIILIIYFTFKLLFNYKKCTISYLECKLRHVKREDGYLASLLYHIVDLRNTKFKTLLYVISAILIMHTKSVKQILKL